MVDSEVSSKDRSIAVGHNVIGSAIVSGDQNHITVTYNEIIQISTSVIQNRKPNWSSPYKGLKGFGLKDKELFFGRDQLIASLLTAVNNSNFLLVLGASGSGKSSVVRAGLIPQLYDKGGTQFQHFLFTPDRDPFDSLYRSLRNPENDHRLSDADAQIVLKAQSHSWVQVVQTLQQKQWQCLFFIDQFEELFTLCQDVNQRKAFIDGMVQVANSGIASVKLVLAMRSDFLDQIHPYPQFAKLIQPNIHFITDMYLDELRLAIEQPAAHHGVIFEPGLVEEIIKDVQGEAGYLPLLQYTLDLLWNEELKVDGLHDRTLNIQTYRNLGGVRGALQQHVESIYKHFSNSEKPATERIFLKLINIGGDEESGTEWKPVRRRANRSEFQDELEKTVLAQLIDEKLVVSDAPKETTTDRPSPSQASTVEIAHEVLLTSWTLLHTWIKENRQAIALRNRLNDDVALWESRKRSEKELWGGSRLEKALELQKDSTFNQVLGGFSPSANQFIDASERKRNYQRYRTVALWTGFSTLTLLSVILFISLATPFVSTVLSYLGYRDFKEKRFSSAIQKYDLAIMLQTDKIKGVIYYDQGLANEGLSNFNSVTSDYHFNSAISDYQAAISAIPSFTPSYNNLARLYILRKDYKVAIKILNKGLRLPEDQKLDREDLDAYKNVKSALLKNLGWAQFELKDPAAKVTLMQAIDIDKQNGSAHCLLAQVLEENSKTGLIVNVRKEYKQCIDLGDPDLPEVKKWQELAHLKTARLKS
ncbi:tetratricopeptide repeat protein [Pantanalinema rosaneae CENA516]|uniref:tetratricopeptide repeat protein n=1 Tax=Pantanalinema rosaneae TaxID=1620701 RepID=UPI003D6DDC76